MSGTPGFMAHECMSMEPVRGAAAHDVVAAAMVSLLVCLKKELRSPNLFANPVRKAWACLPKHACGALEICAVHGFDWVRQSVHFAFEELPP